MTVASDGLIARRLALGHLKKGPDVGRRVGTVKDDRIKAVEAQAKGGKLGLCFLGALEPLRPVVAANRGQLAKQHLVADQSGGGSRHRGWCAVPTGLPARGVVD